MSIRSMVLIYILHVYKFLDKAYVIETYNFHLARLDALVDVPDDIRTKPRQHGGHKVILLIGGFESFKLPGYSLLYDPDEQLWRCKADMMLPHEGGGLAVIKDNYMFYVGGYSFFFKTSLRHLYMLDLTAEKFRWEKSVDMMINRAQLGVGVINNRIYAVGGFYGSISLNSVEEFDCCTQNWRMIASMSTNRAFVGVGVLNNLLYAVGGYNSNGVLNSVECYHPCLNKWTPIAELSSSRRGVGVGVLDDVLYAVGGDDEEIYYDIVEAYRPSTGVWTSIPNMHVCRTNAGVTVLNGLLYVFGGSNETSKLLDCAEYYNPNTNTWTMIPATLTGPLRYIGTLTIIKP